MSQRQAEPEEVQGGKHWQQQLPLHNKGEGDPDAADYLMLPALGNLRLKIPAATSWSKKLHCCIRCP
jgi:hypothetical protein